MDSHKLSKTQPLSMFISQRLTAAVEEIFEAVERTMSEYEEKVNKSNLEIDRQQKLLDTILNPHVKLRREDFQQQHYEQEKSPSLAQKDPEPPQRDHNLQTGQGVEKLRELKEADIVSAIVANQITPESDREGCGEPQSPRDFQPHSEIETEDGGSENDLMQDSITLTSKKSQPLGKGLRSADSTKGSSDCSTLAPHKDTTVFCKVCGFPCSSDNALLQHVQTHATTGSRVCGVCGMFLESPDSLMQHILSHRNYRFTICDTYFPTSRNMKNNTESLKEKVVEKKAGAKRVRKKEILLCSVCGRYFSSKSSFSMHMRTHTGEKPHRCDVCGHVFRQLATLRKHKSIHTEERPYSCDVCGRLFRAKNNLRLHRGVHSEERPYRCDICGKGFRQLSTLTNHKAVHTMEKPHRCDVCGKAFDLRKILVEHMKSKKHLKAVNEENQSD